MNVNSINYDINFKSGLTHNIVILEKNTNTKNIERYFRNSTYRDWGDFRNSVV